MKPTLIATAFALALFGRPALAAPDYHTYYDGPCGAYDGGGFVDPAFCRTGTERMLVTNDTRFGTHVRVSAGVFGLRKLVRNPGR